MDASTPCPFTPDSRIFVNLLMISDNHRPINEGLRLATMVLDHVFMSFIAMIFYLPMFISLIAFATSSMNEKIHPFAFAHNLMTYTGIFGFLVYFLKDIFNGRSLAKRILKLQVVDNKTGQPASPLQCFVRDLFCIIWPVEFIVSMANTSRRIGDRVAGTRLVYFDPAIHQAKLNIGKIILPILICFALAALLVQIIPTPEFDRTVYSNTSFNQDESKELEQLISDSLGEYMIPDIKIYDTVENSKLKYISATFRLRENYLETDNSYRQLHELTTDLIYSRHPMETFTGEIKYIFRGPGQFQSRSTSIGTHSLN